MGVAVKKYDNLDEFVEWVKGSYDSCFYHNLMDKIKDYHDKMAEKDRMDIVDNITKNMKELAKRYPCIVISEEEICKCDAPIGSAIFAPVASDIIGKRLTIDFKE